MKVYLELQRQSRGLGRVRDALVKYAPENIEITKYRSEADLTIIHVYGRHDRIEKQTKYLKERRKPYAMIQYVLRSTMKSNTFHWMNMWQQAKLVWSYYDLFALADEDKTRGEFNFYHAPLGVDTDVFRDYHQERKYTILASGQHALSESVRECVLATKLVGGKMVHLGHQLRRGDDIWCISGINDDDLACIYSQCQFVSGLRRKEGFELEVLEGFMCGARPIVFDMPHYRKWYNDFAVFIPERPREEVIDDLEQLFKKGAKPVTEQEKQWVKNTFNWKIIVGEFWRRLLA